MASDPRTLRRSEAVHPYGPGAILDWGQESFVVLDTSAKNLGWKYGERIQLERLQRRLGASDGFKLAPTNKRRPGVSVQRFPSWLFCPVCRGMVRWGRDLEQQSKGAPPRCRSTRCKRLKTVLVPMRYVAACSAGHLTEVDWYRWAHQNRAGTTQCDPKRAHLKFTSYGSGGASLGAIRIECESCEAGASIEGLLGEHGLRKVRQRCPGRQPWQSRADAVDCDQPLQALQRSQTAVHYSVVEAALDIRMADGDRFVREKVIRDVIERTRDTMYLELSDQRKMAESLARRATDSLQTDAPSEPAVSKEEFEAVLGLIEAEGVGNEEPRGETAEEMMGNEWKVLSHPGGVGLTDSNAPIRVRDEPIRSDSPFERFIAGVHLVERLREVRAFVGFRRVTPDGDLVYPNLGRRRPTWLPAVEVFGEGIFLRFEEAALQEWEDREREGLAKRYADVVARLQRADDFTRQYADRIDVLSRFVMVHTLSHVLIRELCYECGYSAASLRERLYVFPDKAGVLIYTADGDSEGSLGGLVRQGSFDRLESTLLAGVQRSAWCSNDPVCRELTGRGPGKTNLAACHACGLTAETSCTEMNGLLDRVLLIGNRQEDGVEGFFSGLLGG